MLHREDTKLIDFVAALAAGLTIQYRAWSSVAPLLINPGMFTADNFKYASLYMGAFALAALIVFLWKGRLRRVIGWVLIAILGAGFCSGIQEYRVARAFERHPMALFEGYGFALLNFMLNCCTALLVMGIVHLCGILVREGRRKLAGRYP